MPTKLSRGAEIIDESPENLVTYLNLYWLILIITTYDEHCSNWSIQDEAMKKLHALNMNGAPEDIAAACAYLCSDSAKWVTGTLMVVDGYLHSFFLTNKFMK